MTTRDALPPVPLDPQARAFLDDWAGRFAAAVPPASVAEARARYRASRLSRQQHPADVAERVDLVLQGAAGPLAARLFRGAGTAPEARLPVVAFFHGGGWVVGDLDTHEVPCRALASHARCAVVAVDYRLAPEHRFPAAFDDAVAAVRDLAGRAAELRLDPDCLIVAGDSAGGNLAAAAALALRGDATARVAMQVLIYPATDLRAGSASHHAFAKGFLLERVDVLHSIGQYLRDPADALDWRASPLLAPDLAGAPPAYVLTAGHDPLRDEGDSYALRLEQAGVPVTRECFEGMIHGFIALGGVMAAGGHAMYRAAQAMRQRFPARFGVKRPDRRV